MMMSIETEFTRDYLSENDNFVKSLRLMSCTRNGVEAERFLTDAIDAVKRTFDNVTGDTCCVTLKMSRMDGNVYTYVRDRNSPVSRFVSDLELRSYFAQENSAFRLLTNSSHCHTYYLCNDLSANTDYANANVGWDKLYNATLVASVRAPFSLTDRCFDIMGFLCVDNRNGRFDDISAKALVAFAYEIYFALSVAQRSMHEECREPLSLK
jgi:hypothetical protein